MAGRPPKKNLDFSGWDVDIFDNDTKIDKLLDAQGWTGFGIYFYLCQRAYGSDGYFYRWGYDDCATTARKMGGGIGSGTVRETVGYCLQIGLFDKGLFERWEILTSRGIQRKYWIAIKDRDIKRVIADYWLLQDSECKGLLKEPLNNDLSLENNNIPPENTSFDGGNNNIPPIKNSKEKKSKGNKKQIDKSEIQLFFDEICSQYLNRRGKSSVSEKQKKVLFDIGQDQLLRCINRYKMYLKQNESWLKEKKCSTFFNNGYKDYLDNVYEGGENGGNTGGNAKQNEGGLSGEALKAGIRTDDFTGF